MHIFSLRINGNRFRLSKKSTVLRITSCIHFIFFIFTWWLSLRAFLIPARCNRTRTVWVWTLLSAKWPRILRLLRWLRMQLMSTPEMPANILCGVECTLRCLNWRQHEFFIDLHWLRISICAIPTTRLL